MKFIYTEAAQRELVDFQKRQKALLEELVSDRKLVYGDDVLEITASDIKEAAQRIQPIRPTVRRFQSSELLTRAYIIMGIVMMIGASFYPQIQEILAKNKTQALTFFMGACLTTVGWLFGYWVRLRQRRYVEQLKSFYTLRSNSSRLSSIELRDDGDTSSET